MSAQAPASTVARRIRADPASSGAEDPLRVVRRSADASKMNNALAQAERLWANILALGAKRLTALAMIGLTVFAATGFSRLLSQPADHGDALYRPGSGRRGRHRVDAQGSGDPLRRFGRRRHRDGAGRSGGARAHDLGGEGPAAQRQRRQRALRQARLARPHLVHAAGHARARDGRRTGAHDPDDARRQGRARSYRHGRRRLVPSRAAGPVRLGDHSHRRRRRSLGRPGDPPSRGGRRSPT